MTATAYFKYSTVLKCLHKGPLGIHVDVYAAQLITEGHCYQSGARCIRVVRDFSLWLARNRLAIDDVDEGIVKQYLQFRIRCRRLIISDRSALTRLLAVLRETGVIPPPTPIKLGPLEQIEADFEYYLLQERGLCQVSVIRHRTPLRKFLRECCSEGRWSFSNLTGAQMTQFVRRHAHDQSPHSAFATSSGISMIAVSALTRVGLEVRRMGTHIFRHTLATQLLQAGATLPEIGQVLRHKDHDTTRLYAKVDVNALRKLRLPWPGEAQ